MKTIALSAAAFGLLFVQSVAFAADPPAPAPPGAPAGTAAAPAPAAPAAPAGVPVSEEKKQEARQRYQKALSLFDDGAFDAALIEFKEAYNLAPTYRILYNMGVTSERLKDFVGAVRYYEQYLKDAGGDVKDDQKSSIKEQVQLLRGRIAKLSVKTNVPNATISIDDVPIGEGNFRDREVNSGRRRVTASAPGYVPVQKAIDAPGGENITVDIVLESTQRTVVLRESAHVPWLGILGTLAFSGAAVASGVVALGAGSTYDDMRGDKTGKVTRDELDSQANKAKTWGIVTDLCIVGAVGFAAYTVYDILRPKKATTEKTTTANVGVSYTGQSFFLSSNVRF